VDSCLTFLKECYSKVAFGSTNYKPVMRSGCIKPVKAKCPSHPIETQPTIIYRISMSLHILVPIGSIALYNQAVAAQYPPWKNPTDFDAKRVQDAATTLASSIVRNDSYCFDDTAANWLRVAYHDALTYHKGTGGADASIVNEISAYPEINNGLKPPAQ
jgi:hypothetical protein